MSTIKLGNLNLSKNETADILKEITGEKKVPISEKEKSFLQSILKNMEENKDFITKVK